MPIYSQGDRLICRHITTGSGVRKFFSSMKENIKQILKSKKVAKLIKIAKQVGTVGKRVLVPVLQDTIKTVIPIITKSILNSLAGKFDNQNTQAIIRNIGTKTSESLTKNIVKEVGRLAPKTTKPTKSKKTNSKKQSKTKNGGNFTITRGILANLMKPKISIKPAIIRPVIQLGVNPAETIGSGIHYLS